MFFKKRKSAPMFWRAPVKKFQFTTPSLRGGCKFADRHEPIHEDRE